MIKSDKQRVPVDVYRRVNKIGSLFNIPTTKAFTIQERFLLGDIKVSKIRKRNGKRFAEFEIEI
jgi:hypothetical protein